MMKGDELQSVADPQKRNAEFEHRAVYLRRAFLIDAAGSAGKDDPDRTVHTHGVEREVKRMDLTVHAEFAYPAGYQLCVV